MQENILPFPLPRPAEIAASVSTAIVEVTACLDFAGANLSLALERAPTAGARLTRDEQAWIMDVIERLSDIAAREDARIVA